MNLSLLSKPFTSLSATAFRILLPALLLAGCEQQKPQTSPDLTESKSHKLAAKLDADFAKVLSEVEKLAASTQSLYERKSEILPLVNREKYQVHPSGSFHKPSNDGGAALWISGAVPITEEVKEVAYFTEPLDTELIRITRQMPEVNQAYYNDKNSLNRIYPWFDTVAQYPPKMNIPEFNFYFMADEAHNPAKKGVWVNEPYVDPAGRGWMVSAIAPVYFGGTLVGVPGLDVTISEIVDRYLTDKDAPIAVVAPNGVLVAASEKAIALLEMPPLKDHKYLETVKQDTFKQDQYDLLKSKIRPVRDLAKKILQEKKAGSEPVELLGKPFLAIHAPVPGLDWTVLEFLPQ